MSGLCPSSRWSLTYRERSLDHLNLSKLSSLSSSPTLTCSASSQPSWGSKPLHSSWKQAPIGYRSHSQVLPQPQAHSSAQIFYLSYLQLWQSQLRKEKVVLLTLWGFSPAWQERHGDRNLRHLSHGILSRKQRAGAQLTFSHLFSPWPETTEWRLGIYSYFSVSGTFSLQLMLLGPCLRSLEVKVCQWPLTLQLLLHFPVRVGLFVHPTEQTQQYPWKAQNAWQLENAFFLIRHELAIPLEYFSRKPVLTFIYVSKRATVIIHRKCE